MPDGALTVTIDGRQVEAFEGESILDVARRAGVHIPTLCHVDGLSEWGSCRLCLVETSGTSQLRPACFTRIIDDMEVWTDSRRIQDYRRMIVELLFAEGNHVCSVCVSNGHCELQDLAVDMGVDHIRYEYRYPSRRLDASHPKYVFDANRCVLCTRCVRTCDEIEGAHVWDVASRGSDAYIVSGMDQPWGQVGSCTWCGKCVTACPTGALIYKGRTVAEMVHDRSLVGYLANARAHHEWVDREDGS
jgi:bidirectional [NiFe] hydrogenase diaphorase subunit